MIFKIRCKYSIIKPKDMMCRGIIVGNIIFVFFNHGTPIGARVILYTVKKNAATHYIIIWNLSRRFQAALRKDFMARQAAFVYWHCIMWEAGLTGIGWHDRQCSLVCIMWQAASTSIAWHNSMLTMKDVNHGYRKLWDATWASNARNATDPLYIWFVINFSYCVFRNFLLLPNTL